MLFLVFLLTVNISNAQEMIDDSDNKVQSIVSDDADAFLNILNKFINALSISGYAEWYKESTKLINHFAKYSRSYKTSRFRDDANLFMGLIKFNEMVKLTSNESTFTSYVERMAHFTSKYEGGGFEVETLKLIQENESLFKNKIDNVESFYLPFDGLMNYVNGYQYFIGAKYSDAVREFNVLRKLIQTSDIESSAAELVYRYCVSSYRIMGIERKVNELIDEAKQNFPNDTWVNNL